MPKAAQIDVDALVRRSGPLKQELLGFSQRPRYGPAVRRALAAADPNVVAGEDQLTMVIDHFLLQFRLPNGRTVVEEHFTNPPRPSVA